MKICDAHWSALRQAMKDRGIDHLGAKSGEQVVADIQSDLAGEKSEYDPLMDCHWMVTSRALQIGGLEMMNPNEDGSQKCPICVAEANGVPKNDWITGPADAALMRCREKGLVPKTQ